MELKKKQWNDITIADWLELLEINESTEDPVERQTQIMAYLCDCDEEDILELTITEYTELVRQTMFIYNRPEPIPACPETIELDGKAYRITKDIRNITAGQYIDFQTMYKEYGDDKLGDILSCFIIPEDHAYNDGYDIEVVKATIRTSMPILKAVDVCFFFMKSFQNLITVMEGFLVLKTKMPIKEKMKQLKNLNRLMRLQRSGAG